MNYFQGLNEEELKKKVDDILNEVHEIAKKTNTYTGFTIANTKKHSSTSTPYFPPIRETNHIICGNIIVYTEELAKKVAEYVDGRVDYILVDAEKKILPSEYGENDAGNIELAVFLNTKQSKILTFKANDLTANAVDTLISYSYSPIGGKKIAIIGAGNIGTKVALTLLERGAKIRLYRRDKEKLKSITKALNLIKPSGTISEAEYFDTIEETCFDTDIIIGCTPGIPVISKDCINNMRYGGIIIDIGKGSVSKDVISYAKQKNIKVIREDVRAGFDGIINSIFSTKNLIENDMGEREIDGIMVASGGIMAEEGYIIVDNYKNPTRVVGVSNGEGDFKRELSDEEKQKLKTIEQVIQTKKNGGREKVEKDIYKQTYDAKENQKEEGDLFNIKDKVIVVTGGIGRLGTELSVTLLNHGANVIIVDSDYTKLKEKGEELEKIYGKRCYCLECDISKKDQIEKLKEIILEKFNKLDVLINCAGVGVYTPFEERTEEELDYVINVNIKGTLNCSKILGEIMKNQKKGHIINIGSIYGMVSSDKKIYGDSKRNNSEIYSMTKAGIIMLTKYLAAHWAPYNIQVNCISPGGIINEKKIDREEYKEFVERYNKKNFLNRMGKTSDFKGIILYLVSDASSYMTGSNIVIDGGFTAW